MCSVIYLWDNFSFRNLNFDTIYSIYIYIYKLIERLFVNVRVLPLFLRQLQQLFPRQVHGQAQDQAREQGLLAGE